MMICLAHIEKCEGPNRHVLSLLPSYHSSHTPKQLKGKNVQRRLQAAHFVVRRASPSCARERLRDA